MLLGGSIQASDFLTVSTAKFGNVYLYPPAKQPARNLLIVISGDGGWTRAVPEISRLLSKQNFFVAGIDIRQYGGKMTSRESGCNCPSCDLVQLAGFLRQRFGLNSNQPPLLMGYSSGATLAYAAAAESPAGTFLATFSFGFCPDLEWKRALCRGEGLEGAPLPRGKGELLSPSREMKSLWVAFQGETDQVCDPSVTENFVKQVPGGRIVELPHVGHGFASLKNWLPEFEAVLENVGSQEIASGSRALGGRRP